MSTAPHIRPARPGDVDEIMARIAESRRFIAHSGSDQWQDGYPQREIILRDIEEGIGCVLTDEDGVPQGYCALMTAHEPIYDQIADKWSCPEPYITIHRLAVGDALRGRGAGRALMRYAEARARELGIGSLRADTHRLNSPMQGLMLSEGYIYRGEVNYDDCAGDPIRVAYEKALK